MNKGQISHGTRCINGQFLRVSLAPHLVSQSDFISMQDVPKATKSKLELVPMHAAPVDVPVLGPLFGICPDVPTHSNIMKERERERERKEKEKRKRQC